MKKYTVQLRQALQLFVMRARYRRYHPSYLIGTLSIGFLAGLVVGRAAHEINPTWLIFVGLILLLGGLRSGRWWSFLVLLGAGLLFGGARGATEDARYDAYIHVFGTEVTMTGTLSGDPQVTERGQQKLSLGHLALSGQRYVGEMFVTTYDKRPLKRGDKITIRGTLQPGFASYGASIHAGSIEAVVRPADVIRDIRERFSTALRSVIAEPMASLGLGFVVGQRSTLPDSLDEQLKVVGLTHIVVASGYNLTILVRFVMRLASRHSRYLALSLSLLLITLFVLFSGLSPSMNRAVMVTVLGLAAWYVGRRFQPVLLLLYVAAITAAISPMYIWADLGWHLSFTAFAGILIVAPLVSRLLFKAQEPNAFLQVVCETACAEIMALPLIAFSFGTFPVFGLIANVLVGPFIPAAMALAALAGTVTMVSLSVGSLVALPATLVIAYMLAVVEWLADVSWAQAAVDIGLTGLVGWYGLILLLCMIAAYRMRYSFHVRDRNLEI